MNKQKIIEFYMKDKKLLTNEALEYLIKNPDKVKKIDSDENPLGIENFTENKIKIIMNIEKIEQEIDIQKINNFNMEKYNKIKSLFKEKELTSLKNINQKGRAIVMVSSPSENKISVDDPTDHKDITINKNDLQSGDVVLMDLIKKGNELHSLSFRYPDYNLETPEGHGKILCISDLHLNENNFSLPKTDFDFILIAGDIGDNNKLIEIANKTDKKIFIIPGNIDVNSYPREPIKIEHKNIITLSDPSIIEINNIKILMTHDFNERQLKTRIFPFERITKEPPVIEQIPSIVHYGHTHKPEIKKYKETLIVNSGSPKSEFRPVIIDLKKMEAEFI